jgi:hypothetical protein
VLVPGEFAGREQLFAERARKTLAELPAEELKDSKGALGLFCLFLAPEFTGNKPLTEPEIVQTVQSLQKTGYGTMLFRKSELYDITTFANRYTKLRIHFAVGLALLIRVLQGRYKNLPGSLLEGMARMFTQNVRLVVHPMKAEEMREWAKGTGLKGWTWEETDGMIYAENLHPEKPLDYLYQYLMSEFWILPSKAVRK